MGLALFASLLLKKLSDSTTKEELKKELDASSKFASDEFINQFINHLSHFLNVWYNFLLVHIRYFSQLAIDWLKEAHEHNESFAGFQLCVSQPLLDGVTCLDLAYWNENKKLLSHAASQRVLKQFWMGHLCETSSNRRLLNILMALLLFPFASFLLTFREPAETSVSTAPVSTAPVRHAPVSTDSDNRVGTPDDYFTLPLPPTLMKLKCCSFPASKTCCSLFFVKMLWFFNAPIIVYSYNLVCPTSLHVHFDVGLFRLICWYVCWIDCRCYLSSFYYSSATKFWTSLIDPFLLLLVLWSVFASSHSFQKN